MTRDRLDQREDEDFRRRLLQSRPAAPRPALEILPSSSLDAIAAGALANGIGGPASARLALSLQSLLGNSAARQLIRRAGKPEAEEEEEESGQAATQASASREAATAEAAQTAAPPAPESQETAQEEEPTPAGPEAAQEGESGGTLEEIEGAEVVKSDTALPQSAGASLAVASTGGPPVSGRRLPVEARLTFASAIDPGPASAASSKADPVASALTLDSSLTRGGFTLDAGNFGEEHVTYKVDNASWKTGGGKVNVTGRIFLDIHWDTQPLGRTDVSGASDPAVTKDTWDKIVGDLTPSASGRPPRKSYWALDVTERHEKFHGSDDIGRSKLYVPTAQAWLDKQTVSADSGPIGSAKTMVEAKKLLETVRSNVEADGWAYYDKAGGAGENRAYADGKESYQKRADAISDRATKEKWG